MENQKLQRILEENYEFKFGDYISKGFNILGKNMGGFVGASLIFFIITSLAGALSNVVPFLGNILSSYILGPALLVGFFIVARKVDTGDRHEFNDFFGGFQYIGPLILATVVTTLISLLAAIPFILVNMGSLDAMIGMITDQQNIMEYFGDFRNNFAPWSLILLLFPIYFGVAYAWSSMFIVFHKLSFWDAMEASRIMITKKWFIYFIFSIVVGIIAVAGMLGLCIGMLFTFPAAMAMNYAAFADATQLDLEDGEMDIADHLIGSDL